MHRANPTRAMTVGGGTRPPMMSGRRRRRGRKRRRGEEEQEEQEEEDSEEEARKQRKTGKGRAARGVRLRVVVAPRCVMGVPKCILSAASHPAVDNPCLIADERNFIIAPFCHSLCFPCDCHCIVPYCYRTISYRYRIVHLCFFLCWDSRSNRRLLH